MERTKTPPPVPVKTGQRGGSREGAGRKKKAPEDKPKYYCVALHAETGALMDKCQENKLFVSKMQWASQVLAREAKKLLKQEGIE